MAEQKSSPMVPSTPTSLPWSRRAMAFDSGQEGPGKGRASNRDAALPFTGLSVISESDSDAVKCQFKKGNCLLKLCRTGCSLQLK